MKLAYPVCIPGCCAKVMAMSGDFEGNLKSLSEVGYQGIELLFDRPDQADEKNILSTLDRYRLCTAALGTSPMIAQDKLSLLHPDEEVREEAFHRAVELIGIARHFQAPVTIGKFRGNVSDCRGCTKRDLKEIFERLCEVCEREDVTISVEPQKPDNINNLNTIPETLSWIAEIGSRKLTMMPDTFHMNITEKDIVESIRKCGDRMTFVHLSDTDRLVPGLGALNWNEILNAFRETGYDGWYSMEIKQLPTALEAAQGSIRYFLGNRYL